VKTLSVKLPDDLVEQLDSEARARKVTKSALVRESLERVLFRQKRAQKPRLAMTSRST
jgi:predicted transcriptional regulator